MQDTSLVTNWNTIKASNDYSFVVSADIDGTTYTGYSADSGVGIWSIKKTAPLLTKPEVGRCMSASLELTMVLNSSTSIPRMGQIDVYAQLARGAQISGKLPKGTFYIDTRQKDGDFLHIVAYDAMLRAEQPYTTSGDQGTWPKSDIEVVTEIAQRLGVTLDPRNNMTNNYTIQYPGFGDDAYTVREVLGFIGGLYAGNWIITDANTLRLVPLVVGSSTITIDNTVGNAFKLSTSPAYEPFTGVRIIVGKNDETGQDVVYTSGSLSGRVLEFECPWGTQVAANRIFLLINGFTYVPYNATDATIDPAAELGDGVTVDGALSVIGELTTRFLRLYTADIAAPEDEDVDHEYPFQPSGERAIERKLAKTTTSLKVGLDSIEGRVEDVEEEVSSMFNMTPDMITLTVTETSTQGGNTYASIVLTVDGIERGRGQIILDGNVNVSGELSAEALYATLGDIADLRVNRVETSRRIVKFLAGDTSDDNFIRIQGESLQFVSGTIDAGLDQATNGNGALIYWESNPDAPDVVIGTDGYPYKNGVRIFTTTEETNWPVYIYKYTDLVKAEFNFELDGSTYIPVLVMGAGDGHGNNKFFLRKAPSGLELIYKSNSGKEVGLLGTYDGYLDPVGIRRITSLDFSEWDLGHFVVYSEGGVVMDYNVIFDGNGIPTRIVGPHNNAINITI